MTNKMRSYPNTAFRKVCVEFDKGVHPSEIFASKKTTLKYGTLQQYYHTWKHNKKTVDNPLEGLSALIKDIHELHPDHKQKDPQKPEIKEVKVPTPPEPVISIPQHRIEEKEIDFMPLDRRLRKDPFS